MKKIIKNIIIPLLLVAMLLPLTSCAPRGQAAVGTTENTPTPTTEAITPEVTPEVIPEVTPEVVDDPQRGALIPHTEAMLTLKEKCKHFDEEWMEKILEIFLDVYENDGIRKGDSYLIYIRFKGSLDEDAIVQMMNQVGVEEEIQPVTISNKPGCTFYTTPDLIETIAKTYVDQIQYITYRRNLYDA